MRRHTSAASSTAASSSGRASPLQRLRRATGNASASLPPGNGGPAPPGCWAWFVFNPTLSKGETDEEEKILFFHPRETSLDSQAELVGISEALSNFTSDFADDAPVRALHCMKRRFAFYRLEKDFWMVLAVENPIQAAARKDEPAIYAPDEHSDNVLQSVLERAAVSFRLFNGPLAPQVQTREGLRRLKARFSEFFSYLIPTVRWGQLTKYTDITGFRFFPVDRRTFLDIQGLAARLHGHNRSCRRLSLLCDSRLIWSGFSHSDMRALYSLDQDPGASLRQYLVVSPGRRPPADAGGASGELAGGSAKKGASKSVFDRLRSATSPKASEDAAASAAAATASSSSSTGASSFFGSSSKAPHASSAGVAAAGGGTAAAAGRGALSWMVGVPRGAARAPLVHLKDGSRARLLMLRYASLTLMFSVEDDELELDADAAFYDSIAEFLVPLLDPLAELLIRQAERLKEQPEPFRFLYFNKLSLALKTSLSSTASAPLSPYIIDAIRDIHSSFLRPAKHSELNEVCLKTPAGWIVGRRAIESSREWYLVVDEKDAPALPELQHQIDLLQKKQFKQVFML